MNSLRIQCRLLSEIDSSQYNAKLQSFSLLNFQEQLLSIQSRFQLSMNNYLTTGLVWEGYDEYKFCVCQLQLIDKNLGEDQFEELTELIIEMNSNPLLQEILDLVYEQKQESNIQSLKHMKINNRNINHNQQIQTTQYQQQQKKQSFQLEYQSQQSQQSVQLQLQNSVFREQKIDLKNLEISMQNINSDKQSIRNILQLESSKFINNKSSKLLQEAQTYRIDSYLDQAHDIVQNIKFEDLLIEEQKIYQEIEDSYNFMMKNLTELQSDGWTLDKSSNGISVYYKFPKNTETVSLRMEATIDCDILKLMALISEVALFPKYVPFCNHAEMLKQISRTQKICQSQLHFPIISDRETTFLGEGIDRLKLNGTVLFLCRSVDQQYLEEQNVQVNKQRFVSLDVNYYIFEITPITQNRCKIKAVNNSDPKMPYLPKWVAGFIARKFTFNLVEKIVKYTQNFEKSPWAKYLDNEFYGWLREKIQNYWDNV